MATQKVWCDQDGINVGVLKGWRLNPLTTAERLALGNTLHVSNVGLCVFDIDLLSQFFWSGSVWISAGSSVNNLDFIQQGSINKYLSITEYNQFLQLISFLPTFLDSSFPSQEVILTDTDYVYTRQPLYYVSGIIVIPGEETMVSMGTTDGANDIVYDETVDVIGKIFFIPRFTTLSENIYINGLTVGTKLIILKELIKTTSGGNPPPPSFPPAIEEVATFADISPSTVVRFIYVVADETNNGDRTTYLYSSLTGLTRLETVQTP